MCGMVTKDSIKLQQSHYTEMNSHKMGTQWASYSSKKMWGIIFSIWKHRCNMFYDKGEQARLSGVAQLKVAIVKEYETGVGDIPSLYSNFFHVPLTTLGTRSDHIFRVVP